MTSLSVKTGILGRSRSAVSRRNRFYRPFDAIKFRALNALYPTPLWDFRAQAQAVIVNLGTNDIGNNKGDPGPPFETAYTGLLQTVRAKYPGALIVCLVGPLLSGTDLSTIQEHIKASVNARVAAGDRNIEFFDEIAPQTSDKAACQYHPNPAENQIMADQLVTELRAKLGW